MTNQTNVCAKQDYDFTSMSDRQVAELLGTIHAGLTVDESRHLQTNILRRPPTLAELILFGIEGSEHCSYKSSRHYLKQFVTEGPDVIIGAKEDAGIIRVAQDADGNAYAVVLSHESHNHPSQIVPYEGAATGVGGNVRDVCCMGANVAALADDLRFGTLEDPHNVWLMDEVVSGIAGYANPIGVPNIGGGIQFDDSYNNNCLVTVVTLGLIAEDAIIHSHAPSGAEGYDVILVGKPTDQSGFGGASFASFQLEETKKEANKGAVQEPNAFLGRHLIKASTELFALLKSKQLLDKVAFKDLGAGGIACASVELAESGGYGATIDLDRVHVTDNSIASHVILCAETQERYMWVSHHDVSQIILDHYNTTYALGEVSAKAEARIIGTLTRDGQYKVFSKGQLIVDAPASCVTKGFSYQRPIAPKSTKPVIVPLEWDNDVRNELLSILADCNIADKSCIYDRYDKQVQGCTVVEPGEADCGIIAAFDSSRYPEELRAIGITLTTDQNPRWNAIDPYQGAVNAVAEAYCNTIATGGTPIAISDCLCYGNPEKSEQMYEFAQGCKGVAKASSTLNIPVIAGNVSFYNESDSQAIAPSPMIAMIGKIQDHKKAITIRFKQSTSVLIMIGQRKRECAGSIHYQLHGATGEHLPQPDLEMLSRCATVIRKSNAIGSIFACHDISEGGVATTLAEMAIASGLGCDVTIRSALAINETLFGESFGFVLEVPRHHVSAIMRSFEQHEVDAYVIGTTNGGENVNINSISWSINELASAWKSGLRKLIG